ncbi:MAG: hypothetical protein F7B06_07985 [Opitutae bacterium]|nr:hypothetical protein [Opitutae bacterium]MBC9889772.1 hypothetical protein [Opitutae bacterium]
MKIRLISTLLSLFILSGGLNFTILKADSHEADASEEGTKLSGHMEEISKVFRRLRRQIRDTSKNADSAALAGQMLEQAKASLELEPAWTGDQPESEQADFVAGFKKNMKEFIGLLEDLQAAFQADDTDKAVAVVAKLRDHQKESHNAYKKPDDD